MKFEIPFNRTFYQYQSKLEFRISWEEHLKNIRDWLKIGGIIFLVGVVMLVCNSLMGFIPLVIGGYYLAFYFQYYRNYRVEKKDYFDRVDRYMEKFEASGEPQLWEFSEEKFHFGDFQYEVFLKWENFSCFRIVEENLIMYLEDSDLSDFYALGKAEVGEKNFDKVVEFVKTKLELFPE